MELRASLLPPSLSEATVARLAELAALIDNTPLSACQELIQEFSQLSGCEIPHAHFQGIYNAEEHHTWVRRLLVSEKTKPVADITREELVEITRRAMPQNEFNDFEAYMKILDCNLPNSSILIFYPPDYDASTNTWAGGRVMGEYDPTPEQIVDWKLNEDNAG